MDVVTKQREVFFNNLLILGFDKASTEKEYRTTCDKNMFCVPNQKMFEVVTYFLFSKLNQVSDSKYSVPWPLMDKDQHRQFQKSCFNHLSNIAQDSNIKFPRIVSSLLSSFGGDRFYELYLAFSNHVVQRTIIKKNNVSLIMMPTINHQNCQDVVDTLKMATIFSVENFQEIQDFSFKHLKLQFKFASQYAEQIHQLKLSLTTYRSLLKENTNTLKKLYSNNQKAECKENIKELLKYSKKVKDLWLLFEKFLVKESKLWSYLCSEVDGNCEKYILNGADFNFNISDNIKKCCRALTEVDRIRTDENKKLDLVRHIETFHTLLEYYMKTTIKGELLQVNKLCLNKDTSRLEESLKQIQSLNDNLVTNILPNIKDSTQKLEDNLKESFEDLEIILKGCPSWSCCSKVFQENVSTFRSQRDSTSPYIAEGCNSSLLFNDVSTNCLEDFSKRHGFYATARTSNDWHSTIGCSSSEVPKSLALLTNETLQDVEMNIPENSLKTNNCFGLNVADSNFQQNLSQNPLTEPFTVHTQHPRLFCPSDVEDFELDIEYKKPFKLRESWQNEESLSAMTLEDLSGLE